MKKSLSLAALLTALATSIATSPATYGTSASVAVGPIVLTTEDPSVDLDLAITSSGDFDSQRLYLNLGGENLTTSSVDLVLVDAETGAELDRVTVAGGFVDEPASISVALDASAAWGDVVSVSLELEGEGRVEGLLSVDAYPDLDRQPAEGDEPTLTLEVL